MPFCFSGMSTRAIIAQMAAWKGLQQATGNGVNGLLQQQAGLLHVRVGPVGPLVLKVRSKEVENDSIVIVEAQTVYSALNRLLERLELIERNQGRPPVPAKLPPRRYRALSSCFNNSGPRFSNICIFWF